MADGYLGEFPVDIATSIFAEYTPADWAMYFIERYGQIDGGHHKAWVLDQVSRILKGTPITIVQARWKDHKPEFRVSTGDPSENYLEWVEEMYGDVVDQETQEREYSYDDGIAP